jgi:hypothetical protein
MLAELLNVSDEELAQIVSKWIYNDAKVPVNAMDVFGMAVMAWKTVIHLNARMNNYDGKGQGDMLTVKETMRLTGLSRSSINRLMRRHRLNSAKVDGRRYIFRVSVEAYMDSNRQYRFNLFTPRKGLRLPWLKRGQLKQAYAKAVMDVPPMFEEQRHPSTTAEPTHSEPATTESATGPQPDPVLEAA